MIYAIITFSLLLVVGIIIFLHLYHKTCAEIISLGRTSEVSISDFESLCTPTRIFTDGEVSTFLNNTRPIIVDIRKISSSLLYKDKCQKQKSFFQVQDYYDNISQYQSENNELYNGIVCVNNNLSELWRRQNIINADCIYQAHHEIENHKKLCAPIVQKIILLRNRGCLKYTVDPNRANDFIEEYNVTINEEHIKTHNEKFVSKYKFENKEFFDTCLKYPLDEQQRDAILHLEDNTLVIASAGSGKTSTLVGKVRYMVNVKKQDPSRILVITYTRKAATELSERMGINGITCSTFHSLAYKIIAEVTGHKPTICEQDFMLNCFYSMRNNNESFLCAINKYILEMMSLMKSEHEYDDAKEYYADRKKYGIQAMFKDMCDKIIFTKSHEEKQICEWLSVHDIQFDYEDEYEYETSDKKYRQYKPDFSIYYTNERGRPCRLYLEHFGIDANGNVPNWFGTDYNAICQNDEDKVARWSRSNKKYKDGIEWKKNLHREKGTKLIYTTSAMFHDGTIWKNLEQQLRSHGVPVKHLSPEELYSKLVQRNKGLEHSIYNLLKQFTTLQKTNFVSIDKLIAKIFIWKENGNDRSKFIVSEIMKPFITYYNNELSRNHYIDYTDAIIQATQLCNRSLWVDYDYILVDEFQDISKDRYMFLNSLRKNKPDCFTKLFCVGDDWQSIYRFSGSDMSLFYDFEKFFGYTKHCKIETTYRFHNPLIKISSRFIQVNPHQVKKNIRDFSVKLENSNDLELSEQQTPKTEISLHKYASDEDERGQVEKIISEIPYNESILVIARYNYDSGSLGFEFTPQDADKKVIWLTLAGRKIRFMAIHGSKGLEADHVIIINCNSGTYGFPSLIEDDPVLSFVLSDKDLYENAEERRVFYVAITRAKKRTHIFYNEKTPSCFVEELMGGHRRPDNAYIPCPECGIGYIIPFWEGSTGNEERVGLSCTNKSGGCRHVEFMSKQEYLEKIDEFKENEVVFYYKNQQ